VIAAVAAAKELPQLGLLDALELTMLIARKDSSRYPRVAARWLQRYLEEHPGVTIEDAGLAASCLIALPGSRHREAAQTLKTMAELEHDTTHVEAEFSRRKGEGSMTVRDCRTQGSTRRRRDGSQRART
jgi:hypothetical protein